MKWMFSLLVTINIGIFLWGALQTDSLLQEETGTSLEVGDLRILEPEQVERLKATAKAKRDAGMPVSDSQEPQPSRQTVEDEQPNSDDSVLGSSEPIIAAESSGPSEIISFLTPDAISPVEVQPSLEEDSPPDRLASDLIPDSEPEPALDSGNETPATTQDGEGAAKIAVDLSAPLDGSEDGGISASGEEGSAEPVASPDYSCRVLGPIEDEILARSILEELDQNDATASLRSEPLQRVTGYWVVLPTYNDYDAAIEAIKSLKQQGVVDIQRFYRGELKNGVSLGIYNRRINAEKRKSQIEAKGFVPEILPRYTEIPAYWIDYSAVRSSRIFDRISDRYPALESNDTECPGRN